MTINELVEEVCNGNITSVEVYDDYFQDWSDNKRSMFLAKLSVKMHGEVIGGTRWDNLIYDKCRHCSEYLKKQWDKEEMPKQEVGSNALTTERTLDEEAIGNWFNAQFKGAGNNNINKLDDSLIPDLKEKRSNKDFAKIAYLIHNSKYCICRNTPFSKFYQNFCVAVGCEQKKYTPCNLKDNEFAKKFYYLQ